MWNFRVAVLWSVDQELEPSTLLFTPFFFFFFLICMGKGNFSSRVFFTHNCDITLWKSHPLLLGMSFFWTFSNKCVTQSFRSCVKEVVSISHGNHISSNGWQAHYPCFSAPSAVWQAKCKWLKQKILKAKYGQVLPLGYVGTKFNHYRADSGSKWCQQCSDSNTSISDI